MSTLNTTCKDQTTYIPQHVAWFRTPLWQGENPLQLIYRGTHLDTVATHKREGLFNIYPVAKPPGSVVAGIALVNQLLSTGRLFISKDCTNLIKEIETYTWRTSAREEPKKGYGDHAIDALRYVISSLCAGTEMTVMSMKGRQRTGARDR